MNLKEIKEIIKLMNDNDLTEIEVEREGAKLKLKKTSDQIETFIQPTIHPQHQPASAAVSGQQSVEPAESSTPGAGQKSITSPMVGTFYRAPSPEAPPFAEVGQAVEVGQVVCIVEAMKLMNEIKSDVKGKIVEAVVYNAEPVEFGQTLFVVEPF